MLSHKPYSWTPSIKCLKYELLSSGLTLISFSQQFCFTHLWRRKNIVIRDTFFCFYCSVIFLFARFLARTFEQTKFWPNFAWKFDLLFHLENVVKNQSFLSEGFKCSKLLFLQSWKWAFSNSLRMIHTQCDQIGRFIGVWASF